MANLFAYRTFSPNIMKKASDPIGIENDAWLKKLSNETDLVIAAWGNHGSYMNRSEQIKTTVSNLHYLEMNKSGEPKHPLYIKGDTKPKRI